MTGRRLLAAAALLHIGIAVLLFAAGRMQVAPRVVNRDGIVRAASDSLIYQQEAMRPGAWRDAGAPPHVRLLSVAFVLLAPLLGYSTLAAEPINLLCYLAIVGLAFAIAREAGGQRAGLVAAAAVALWPTFVFHTTQFLKDPPFIAGALALVLVTVTWLTRTYDWRAAVAAAILMSGAASLLLLIRSKFAAVAVALIALAAILLVVRQVAERRLLVWNLACALFTLAAAAVMLPQYSARTYEKVKAHPAAYRGESKSLAEGHVRRVPAVVVWRAPQPAQWPLRAADDATVALASIRGRYVVSDRTSGSGIDDRITYNDTRELIAHLPRAAAIGLWAPFPAMWAESGQTTGRSGRLLAAAETCAIYVFELLAVAAAVLRPRRLAAFLLLVTAASGVTLLAVVVSNLGTLYRFRYSFWILLIVAGAAGGEKLLHAWRRAEGRRLAVLASITLMICSCARATPRGQLAIVNGTGVKINAVYLSPSDAPAWEENVLGRDVLRDGETVSVRFHPDDRSVLWDLRVDGGSYRAEWTRLDRRRISSIALRYERHVAIAELRGQ